MRQCLPIALIAAFAPAAAVGADPIPGPVNARVVSVYDGDTLTVDAEPWPGLTARTAVRVAGVDTPEIRGKCPAEKDMAIRARDFVRSTVKDQVQLANTGHSDPASATWRQQQYRLFPPSVSGLT